MRPDDASLLYKRGLIYEFMQYPFPLVDSMYNQVLAVDPAYTPVYHRKSMLYMKQKKHEKAHIYIDKAIDKVPNNVYYNYTKGKIYLQEKDYSLAYSYFNVARLINKNIAAIYMGLCESLLGTSIQRESGRQEQNLIQADSYCNTGLTLLHRARVKLQLEHPEETDFSDIGSEISSLLEEMSVEEAMVRIKDLMRKLRRCLCDRRVTIVAFSTICGFFSKIMKKGLFAAGMGVKIVYEFCKSGTFLLF